MAWATSTLGESSYQAALAADKPILISGNVLTSMVWHTWDGVGSFPYASADDSATGFPAYRSYDGHGHSATQANISAGEFRHNLDSGSTLLSGTFDCLFLIFDPGYATGGVDIGLQVQIADDAPFTVNATNIYSDATIASDSGIQRAVSLNLNSYTQYSGSGYVRFDFYTSDSSDFTQPPVVYEAILGKRYQLSKKAIRPYDPRAIGSVRATHQAESGATTSYVMRSGQMVHDFEWQIDSSGGNYSLNDVTTFQSFWNDTQYGAESFVYVEDPSTEPAYARLMRTDKNYLNMPFQGPYERMISLPMEELPPFAGWSAT